MSDSADSGDSGGLFGELFTSAAGARALSDRAWLQALLDAEAALARAQARVGVIPAAAAVAITGACAADRFDMADLGRRAGQSGNPVIPLLADLRVLVGAETGRYVHHGATSQDIVDTAMSLLARRALAPILEDLAAVAGACAALAAEHSDTLMAARTLMQQAAPTTFGLRAAGWLVAVDDARVVLHRVRHERLAVQLGGPVGNLAALGLDGPAVAAAMAEELELALPALPWHTDRSRFAALAAALGSACGVLGKMAGDVILLAQSEVAEASLGDGGGSSSMPQKRNPVAAILTVAAARRAPGLVGTLLTTMEQEHERAAGAWHAEWPALTDLLAVTAGAGLHARMLLGQLRVDVARMAANVDSRPGLMAEAIAGALAPALGREPADELVRACVDDAEARRVPLREVLLGEPRVAAVLTAAALEHLLDARRHLGANDELIRSALRLHADVAARLGGT